MQEVAPLDFRVEFDFNGALVHVERALPILRALEKIPVVKGIEEPIFAYDIEGWRRLHKQIRIPFYLHGVSTIFDGPVRQPSGPWLGLRAGDFDGALCSHETVRNALAASWAFAAANTPILLQYVGTGITTAFACQLGAVMHTATLPGVTASHSYEDDLIAEPLIVEIGFMKVPEGPGLGVELDEDAIERYGHTAAAIWPRHFSVVSLPGGVEHYYRNLQQAERLMKQGVDEPFVPGVRLREREDDGSEEFARIWTRLEQSDWPVWD
jgi:hypothetical protein